MSDGKKIISYCLWGNDPRYTFTALWNCELAKIHFPGWICRFYCGTIPVGIREEMNKHDNVEIIDMSIDEGWNGMFWRFYPASERDVSVMISRDVDSALCMRDSLAVKEWLDSDKKFHIMRDSYYHGIYICGGMWGVRDGFLIDMKDLINSYHRKESNNRKNIDQEFLADIIYPRIISSAFVHDTFDREIGDRTKDFPIPRKPPFRELTLNNDHDDDYIGKVIIPDPKKYVGDKYFNL